MDLHRGPSPDGHRNHDTEEVLVYSEREKVFYVAKMWSAGLRPATASRLWGRPSRPTLSAWEREALEGTLPASMPRIPGSCEHAKHQRYPRETRDEALRLASLGKRSDEIARMLGLPNGGVVAAWVRGKRAAARMSGKARPEGARRDGGATGVRTDEEYERLRTRLEEAEAMVDVYKAVVLDPKALDLGSRPNRWKTELGERLRREFGLRLGDVLSLLRMSKSTYEYNRSRLGSPERGSDADVEEAVVEAFEVAGRGARGYRFVHAVLRRNGTVCSEKRVRRVMRRRGLVPRCLRAEKRFSSYEGEIDDGAPNLLIDEHKRHDFRRDRPFELWLTDVTEFSIPAGRLYLSPLIDCLDGAPLSWSVSERPDSRLSDSMLRGAIAQAPEGATPVLHSDRGALYRSASWCRACADARITRSMSRLARSPDNARMEGFFGTMKNEMFYGIDWSLATLDDLRGAIDGYMGAYNCERIKSFREEGLGPRGGRRGRLTYETINERRERLGFPPAVAVKCDPSAS